MPSFMDTINNHAFQCSPLSLYPLGLQRYNGNLKSSPEKKTGVIQQSNGDVLFRLYSPGAKDVSVCLDSLTIHLGSKVDILELERTGASFPEVSLPLAEVEDGFFEGTLKKSELDGFYGPFAYTFQADGAAFVHPYGRVVYRGNHLVNIFEVPDPDPEYQKYYTIQNVPHSSVNYEIFWSDTRNDWTPCLIYTPPTYYEDDREYPVLYLQHGGGENETGWFTLGSVAQIMDNLIAEGKAEPCLVVMNNTQLYVRQSDVDAGMDPGISRYTQVDAVIADESRTYVEKKYRVKKDKESRAIAGLSQGSMQSSYVGFSHPELYAYIGMFSSSIRCRFYWTEYDANPHLAIIRNGLDKVEEAYKAIYRGVGYQEHESRPWHKEDDKYLADIGFDQMKCYYYKLHPTMCHEWGCFRRSLCDFAQIIFK